jgi:hypothetical protein
MRERLKKQRMKIVEMEAHAAEMEKEIKKAEEEQLGYLARSAANTLSGGMEEVFELLRSLRAKPNSGEMPDNTASAATGANPEPHTNSDENKEGETVDEHDETDETEETEV